MDRTDEDRAVAPEGNRRPHLDRWPRLSDNQLESASLSRAPIVRRLIADLLAERSEVERMADALWAIRDGAEAGPQDRIIAAGGLGDRYDHSKPNGR